MAEMDALLPAAGSAGDAAVPGVGFASDGESDSDVEVVGAAAVPSTVGGKRGRAKSDPDAAFDKLVHKFPSLASSRLDREAFKKGFVKCRHCNTTLAAGNLSNLKKHFSTPSHAAAAASTVVTHNVIGLQRAAAAGTAVLDAGRVKEVQAWLALAAVRYAPPADIPHLLDGALFAASATLVRAGKSLTVGGTTDRALDAGLALLRGEMKARLRDKSMCIIIDEATTHLAGYARPMAVILGCSAVGKPLLSKLMFNMPTAPEAAAGIRDALSLYDVDLATQVTCVVGDNASLVDAIAEQLGLPRLRCIPHCLHLVFKKGTAGFKHWRTVTQGLSGLLTQGGTPRRLRALEAAGLAATKLRGNALRWGQMQDISKYLLSEFGDLEKAGVLEAVRGVVTDHSSFHLSDASDSEGEAGTDNEDAAAHGGGAAAAAAAATPPPITRAIPTKVALRKLRQSLEVGVADHSRKFLAAFECYLVEVLFGSLPALVTAAGADAEHLDGTLPSKLQRFRNVLAEAADAGMQGVVVERVFEKGMTDYSDAEKKQLITKYSPLIQSAATVALEQYDKFIPQALRQLEHRMRFHPANKPEMLTVAPGSNITASGLEAFFGVAKGDVTLEVAAEWRNYVRNWPGISDAAKKHSAAEFWATLDATEEYPHLSKLGRWYADMPTSSVAAERAFGVMRAMDSDLRCSMSAASVERELMARVNAWVVKDMLGRAVAACK